MKLLVTSGLGLSEEQIQQLLDVADQGGQEASVLIRDDREPLDDDALGADVVVGSGFLRKCSVDQLPNLRFVQFTSAGLDGLPLQELDSRGIRYASAQGVYTQPMTEWALLQILRIYKHSSWFDKNQVDHRWEKRRDLLELSGKTAVIIGYGSVGSSIGHLLTSLGVTVLGVSRTPKEVPSPGTHVPLDRLDSVLPEADIVVLSIAHAPQTHHLMSKERLRRMKEGSVLLNLARGGILDTDALVEEVRAGKFRGVALDVFEEEPLPPNSPLWDLPGVINTPHISFASDRTGQRMFELVLHNIRRLARGEVSALGDLPDYAGK